MSIYAFLGSKWQLRQYASLIADIFFCNSQISSK